MKNQEIIQEKLIKAGLLAVVNTTDSEKAVKIAKSLLKKGCGAMEIAYRTLDNFEGADECIRRIRKEVPEILIGAATVKNPEIAKRARKAGAMFGLSAGFNPRTVKWCVRHDFPIVPGIATAGELEQGLDLGLTLFKLFPVEVLGGEAMLKALGSPFPNAKFLVSGGVNAENAEKYKKIPNVAVVSGSYLVKLCDE